MLYPYLTRSTAIPPMLAQLHIAHACVAARPWPRGGGCILSWAKQIAAESTLTTRWSILLISGILAEWWVVCDLGRASSYLRVTQFNINTNHIHLQVRCHMSGLGQPRHDMNDATPKKSFTVPNSRREGREWGISNRVIEGKWGTDGRGREREKQESNFHSLIFGIDID